MNTNMIILSDIHKYKYKYDTILVKKEYIYMYVYGYKSYKSMQSNAHICQNLPVMVLGL